MLKRWGVETLERERGEGGEGERGGREKRKHEFLLVFHRS